MPITKNSNFEQHEYFLGATGIEDSVEHHLIADVPVGAFLSGGLRDIRTEARTEYFLFLALSITGLLLLVSSVDVITLFIALELSSYPLYLMVPMRRERAGQRSPRRQAALAKR